MVAGGPAGVGTAGPPGYGSNTGGGAERAGPPWHDSPPLNTGVYDTAGPPKHEYADPKHEYPTDPVHPNEYPLPVQPYPLPDPPQHPPRSNHRRTRLRNPPSHPPHPPAAKADPEQPAGYAEPAQLYRGAANPEHPAGAADAEPTHPPHPPRPKNTSRNRPPNSGPSGAVVRAVIRTRLYMAFRR
jgi:hypothetical protein